MVERANADKLPQDHELRKKAEEFEEAAIGLNATPQTCGIKKFMGCWARARKAWCNYSGESLI
jgi:hypothetical protein